MNSTRKTLLVLAANPADTPPLRLDKEVREISEGLQRSAQRDQFVLKQQWAARTTDIRRAMLEHLPVIVHFCGHGQGEAGIAFVDDADHSVLVGAEALAGFFKLFAAHVECVVLNACYSEVQAEAIARHIEYVVGMNQAIGDAAAVEFAVAFYDALGAGQSYEFAYRLGCNALQLKGIPEHLTPVLKTRRQAAVETGRHFSAFAGLSVFLAETPDDLHNQRQQVKTYLEQHNIRVLPQNMYYFPDAGALEQAIRADLQQADLFAQLLGGCTPPRPPGMSTPLLQYRLTKEHGKLPLLQWRSADTVLPDEAEYRAFAPMVSSLEAFKQYLTQQLNALLEKRRIAEQLRHIHQPAPGDRLVFINAAPEDSGLAARIGEVLDNRQVGYSLPLPGELPPEDKRRDLDSNLLDCDGVIVVYDTVSVVWVREQVLYCRRVAARREQPLRVIAVCNRVGQGKQPLSMKLPNLRVLEFEQPDACLPEFLSALEDGA